MNKPSILTPIAACAAALILATPRIALATGTTFDDFNVNSGHFASVYNASGSTVGLTAPSALSRITTGTLEGTGCQKMLLANTGAAAAIRLRNLSGGGSPANNIAFTTSAATDGWIGLYLKADASTDPNWTVQIWLEGASINGSVPKTIICDGTWHLYEWNVDDTSGGADGWGSIAGIIAGVATVADGSHTIDSVILRNASWAGTNEIDMDFVARNDSGHVSDLLSAPCLATSGVLVSGPIGTNSNQVTVSGVSGTATAVTVYQDSGGGPVSIGTKTSGIVAGNNIVTVSGLVKTAIASATQTVSGQESCVPTTGLLVGGGANPSIRVALSIRETSSTGPIGAPAGDLTSTTIHFLGASTVSGGAPVDAAIVSPSNQWQTLSFSTGLETIGDASNAVGAAVAGSGYAANDDVALQVLAFRTYQGVKFTSVTPAQSLDITSNDVFIANWTWDAVPGAEGYRLYRSLDSSGFGGDYVDVTNNSFSDSNTAWMPLLALLPTSTPTTQSIQWNPTVGNPNNIGTPWGILEALGLSISGLADTGPFDIYLDNFKNGTNVFQDFEGALAGTTDYGFRAPSFSGTTSGSILTTPNVGAVANSAADTGTKSFHVQFQWSGTNATKWLRLTTSGVGNPMVDLSQPISFRMLLLPVGSSPVAPPGPIITASNTPPTGVILNWPGTHLLMESPTVTGPYTTNTTTTVGPFTNTSPTGQKYYRLRD